MKNYTNYLNDENPIVELELVTGEKMQIQLFKEVAPLSVENFLELVEEDYYKDIIFHRVIKNFMIQAGDKTGTGMGGSNKTIKGEFIQNGINNELQHTKGVISMARTNRPDSASSQFFIMHADCPHLDGLYAAFGVVTNGVEVIDMIANSQTDYNDKPLKNIVIKTIRRVK